MPKKTVAKQITQVKQTLSKPPPGDKVKITLKDKIEHTGILMPRPDVHIIDDPHITIKLSSGYNIGIKETNIKNIEVLEKCPPPKEYKSTLKHNDNLPTVSILSTGGTISSKIDYTSGGVSADLTAEDFVRMCPEMQDIANIKAKKVMSIMSEDMLPNDWSNMAKLIHKELQTDISGVIVTIGTDMLHFCAAALSFMLGKINKPVIITASQRSIDRGSTDAFMNLICAVKAAAAWDGAEVATCLHGTTDDEYCLLIRGTKVRKMHTSRRDAFRPMNEAALAKIYPNKPIQITNKEYRKRHNGRFTPQTKFEEKIALITVYPNMDPEIINFHLKKGCKGIVIAATALGHVPTWTKSSLIPYIKKATEKKIPVIICSQTLYGAMHPYVYTNLRKVSLEAHGTFVHDMLPEVAYIKLGWVLAQTTSYDKVIEMMKENIAGEINDRTHIDVFLK
jgi:glutamyl-tRNA(Gln) amidotransferase subunit D